MSLETLSRQNPWWRDKIFIERDPHIEDLQTSPLKWRPRFLAALRAEEDLVYVIYGPRQVGKTTSFKMFIKDLLSRPGLSPRRILYLNCEEVAAGTPQAMADFMDEYIGWARTDSDDRLYLFIDEATYIKDWERGVKILADRGRLKGTCVFATGSHLAGLKRGAERLPGRRGRGTDLDIFLHPLSFREYLLVHRPELALKIPVVKSWDQEELSAHIKEAALYGDIIRPLFKRFLRSGGFPRPVRDLAAYGLIKADVFRLYKEALLSDMVRMGRREAAFRELCQWILIRGQNPFEWTDGARETSVGTYPTVREYIEDAEAAFLWNVIYKLRNLAKPFRAPRSGKKVYFRDPFVFHAIRSWVLGYQAPYEAAEEFLKDPAGTGVLVENIVASHLGRQGQGDMFYWKNGGEIDFVIFEGAERKALVEVKYQERGAASRAKSLIRAGGGIVLSKNEISREKGTLCLPVSYFLAVRE